MSALLALALAGCAAPPAPGGCKMGRVSDLPLQRLGRHVLVDARINDAPTRLIFDTGAFTSLLTPAAVDRLHVSLQRAMVGEVRGIGGSRDMSIVEARTVELGNTKGRNFPFSSADMGAADDGFGADGLLSSDLLSKWDIDLDFKANKISLYLPIGDCRYPAAALSGSLYQVPLLPFNDDRRPMIDLVIGGKHFVALIDTGAAFTSIFRNAASRLGLRIADLTADRQGAMQGVGSHVVRAVRHVFEPVSIGDLTISNMPMAIIDQSAGDRVDILLGADFQARVHLWISYSSNTLIMQYPALRSSPGAPP